MNSPASSGPPKPPNNPRQTERREQGQPTRARHDRESCANSRSRGPYRGDAAAASATRPCAQSASPSAGRETARPKFESRKARGGATSEGSERRIVIEYLGAISGSDVPHRAQLARHIHETSRALGRSVCEHTCGCHSGKAKREREESGRTEFGDARHCKARLRTHRTASAGEDTST